MSADWQLQVAIRNALANYAPLVAALADGANSIRDHAKQGTPYPYIVIGEADLGNDDTKDSRAWTASVTIHCWSTYAGRKEVKQVLGHVYDALHHQDLPMNGYRCIDCRFETSESFVEPDGKTRHGVMTFDFDVEERDEVDFALTAATLDPAIAYEHPGGKYVEGADGLLNASAENVWPLEYRDGVAVGRSVWEARTNLALWSEALDHSVWEKNNASIVTADDDIAPDGQQTADRVTNNPDNVNTPWLVQRFPEDADDDFTFSSFVRRVGDTSIWLTLYERSEGSPEATSKNVTDDLPLGEQRRVWCYRFIPELGDPTYQAGFGSRTTGNDRDYTVWGNQVERGVTFPGPYIKTEGTPVTRPAESPSFTLGSEYNSAGFTFRVAGESAAGIDGRQVYLSLHDGTTDNAVRVYRDTDRTLYVEVVKDGVQQCLLNMGTLADSAAFSVDVRIKDSAMAARRNNGALVEGGGAVPILKYGNEGHELGGFQCNSILSRVRISPFVDDDLTLFD